jgi:hypothetical protein
MHNLHLSLQGTLQICHGMASSLPIIMLGKGQGKLVKAIMLWGSLGTLSNWLTWHPEPFFL